MLQPMKLRSKCIMMGECTGQKHSSPLSKYAFRRTNIPFHIDTLSVDGASGCRYRHPCIYYNSIIYPCIHAQHIIDPPVRDEEIIRKYLNINQNCSEVQFRTVQNYHICMFRCVLSEIKLAQEMIACIHGSHRHLRCRWVSMEVSMDVGGNRKRYVWEVQKVIF